MDLLRFITCGSVDDGKSTLIGRLLHDSAQLTDEQMAALESAGGRGQPDFAGLVDGLAAEREQGITIDVAYRYFTTATRRFIVADCPGHEQYTRNMVTGASTADAAVLLVDARKGLLTQTRRHAAICRLMGVRQLLLAVNKMDLVGHDPGRFAELAAEFATLPGVGEAATVAIPLSALTGANVFRRAPEMDWYSGPTLADALDAVPVADEEQGTALRLPVQWVNRAGPDFRGYAGLVAGGNIERGQEVRILPSGRTSRIARLLVGEEDVPRAEAGRSVTVTLTDEVECGRGSVIAAPADPPQVADQFEASLVWLHEQELLPGRGYWLQLATQTVTASVQPPKYELGIDSGEQLAAKTLRLNAIGVAEIATDQPLVFDPYGQSRALGGFILIDKATNATVAAGMIHFALRRAQNIHWQATEVSREAHARQKHQQPAVVWLTGLSGSGKSTIANLVEKKLFELGRHSFLLDGDNVRHGLCRDLGFTEADRIENVRRVGEVARLMTDAGLIVITAFISPFRAERAMVRKMFPDGEFLEVYVDTPLDVAEQRDPKGLYAKARAGLLKNFTGVDSPYEPPEEPELRIDTTTTSAEQAAETIVAALQQLSRR